MLAHSVCVAFGPYGPVAPVVNPEPGSSISSRASERLVPLLKSLLVTAAEDGVLILRVTIVVGTRFPGEYVGRPVQVIKTSPRSSVNPSGLSIDVSAAWALQASAPAEVPPPIPICALAKPAARASTASAANHLRKVAITSPACEV